jgi:hypothetical protein
MKKQMMALLVSAKKAGAVLFLLALAAGVMSASPITYGFTVDDLMAAVRTQASPDLVSGCGADIFSGCLAYRVRLVYPGMTGAEAPVASGTDQWFVSVFGTAGNSYTVADDMRPGYGQIRPITTNGDVSSALGQTFAGPMESDRWFRFTTTAGSASAIDIQAYVTFAQLVPDGSGRYTTGEKTWAPEFTVTASAVPEPAYAGLMLALLGAGVAIRRRGAKQQASTK